MGLTGITRVLTVYGLTGVLRASSVLRNYDSPTEQTPGLEVIIRQPSNIPNRERWLSPSAELPNPLTATEWSQSNDIRRSGDQAIPVNVQAHIVDLPLLTRAKRDSIQEEEARASQTRQPMERGSEKMGIRGEAPKRDANPVLATVNIVQPSMPTQEKAQNFRSVGATTMPQLSQLSNFYVEQCLKYQITPEWRLYKKKRRDQRRLQIADKIKLQAELQKRRDEKVKQNAIPVSDAITIGQSQRTNIRNDKNSDKLTNQPRAE